MQTRLTIRAVDTTRHTPKNTEADLAILSAEERARHARFLRAADRRDFAAAHALLRRTLCEVHPGTHPGDWTLTQEKLRKPRLAGPLKPDVTPNVNITHTTGLVACAVVDTGDIGIDAETDRRSIEVDELARNTCSGAERARLAALAPDGRKQPFLDIWTLKESLLKATGEGLAADLTAISFHPDAQPGIRADLPARYSGSERFGLMRPDGESRIGVTLIGTDTDIRLDARFVCADGTTSTLRLTHAEFGRARILAR